MSDTSYFYRQCQTLHVPSGQRCQYHDGHLQRHFARVDNRPAEWGTERLPEPMAVEEKGKARGNG